MIAGADGVELDVRLSADGQVVVLHDPDLSRVTQGRLKTLARNATLKRLREADLGEGERVPSLLEVLEWARGNDARINIELKGEMPDISELVAAVAHAIGDFPAGPERLLLSSFRPQVVKSLALGTAHFVVAWLLDSPLEFRHAARRIQASGATAVHPHHLLLRRESVPKLKASAPIVNTWTVNQPERALALGSLGVDTLISDDPSALLQAFGKQGADPPKGEVGA